MRETDSLLVQQEWRVIDQSSFGPQFHATESFAMDDTLCAFVGAERRQLSPEHGCIIKPLSLESKIRSFHFLNKAWMS